LVREKCLGEYPLLSKGAVSFIVWKNVHRSRENRICRNNCSEEDISFGTWAVLGIFIEAGRVLIFLAVYYFLGVSFPSSNSCGLVLGVVSVEIFVGRVPWSCVLLAGRVFLSQEPCVLPWLRGVARLKLKGVDLPLLAVLGVAERIRVELGAVITI
jgi:hypothetical protein